MLQARAVETRTSTQTMEMPRVVRTIRTREFSLSDEVIVLKDNDVTVEIVSGAAWISHDGQEMFIFEGDSLYVPKAGAGVMISPILKDEVITVRVQWH